MANDINNIIKTRRDLRFWLNEDGKRNGITNRFWYIIRLLLNCENACVFQYIECLRYCEYHYNNKEKLYNRIMFYIYKIKKNRLQVQYNISININTCGYGLRIIHIGGGTRIGPLKAGNYCAFNVGTLIGTNGSEDSRPILGDHVAFGPAAKAFGQITIGDNVFVAANSVVTKDIPDNVIVGGIPAKVIKFKE